MNPLEIQNAFLQRIFSKLDSKDNPVDKIAKVLSLSKPAVYKRLNGSTALSIQDLGLLMKAFDISFDDLIHTDRLSVDFQLPHKNTAVKSFTDFLEPIRSFALQFSSLPNVQVWHATSELHLFYYFMDRDLTNFKFFLHAKTLWKMAGYENLKFSLDDFSSTHLVAEDIDDILNHYLQAPNFELWNENIINNSLNQIKYFLISGYFKYPEEALQLCEKIRALILHLRSMAEKGKKYFPGKEPTATSGDFHLYHNEISYTNNLFLVLSSDYDVIFTTYNNPNFMISSNEKLIDYTKSWFDQVKRLSLPISFDAHQSRMLLFNQIEKKINLAIMEIKHLLQKLN